MNYVGDHAMGNRMGQEQARIRRVIAGGAQPLPAEDSVEATDAEAGEYVTPPGGDARPVAPWRSTVAPGIVVGGLSGALMAVATYLVLSNLVPQQDLRVPAIAQRVVATEQRLDAQERTLRAAEVDVARLIDSQTALSDRVDAQAAQTDAAVASIDAARAEMQAATGGQSPVFGVAVAQLGLAVASGRPFEAEWVNVFSLTADEPDLREILQPLMSVGLTGVETPGALRAQLAALAAAQGLSNAATAGYVQAGMMAMQSNLGIWFGYSAADLMVSEKLAVADGRLASGDVAGAVAALSTLPRSYAERLEPWFETAERHVTVQEGVATLSTAARDRLQSRVRTAEVR